MGRMLGAFDPSNDLDRPDLNKCPDCGCYFPEDACPLCGKICPEEMRAGNRKAQKKKKIKNYSERVTFIEWYHSWWFIVLMLFIWPLLGIVLLLTSPRKKQAKIIFIVIAVLYIAVRVAVPLAIQYLINNAEYPEGDSYDDSPTYVYDESNCDSDGHPQLTAIALSAINATKLV